MSAPLAEQTEVDDNREWLAELLPKAAHKHIAAILDYFAPQSVAEVEVRKTRVPISGLELYGLEIGIDANGWAATVRFPDGAQVTEWHA